MKKENKNIESEDMKNNKKNKKSEIIKTNKKEDVDCKSVIVKKQKEPRIQLKKWLKQTSLTVLLIVIIISAGIGINLAVENANWADFDFTKDKVYSLSEQSKQIAKSLDKEVEIILINMAEAQKDFANKYNSINDKIKVAIVDDITSRPDLAEEYGIPTDGSAIIVKSGEKEKALSSYDLYEIDYTTYTQRDTTEEALTNAIIDVTIDKKTMIYALTGHNKYASDYFYFFFQDLQKEAYEVKELDLLTAGEIPEDCNILLITTLAEDITESERDAILDYINKGGKIIVFSDPNSTGKEMPNFKEVLGKYGVNISEGAILEQDTDKMLAGTPSAILVTISSNTSVTQNVNMNTQASFITTGRIDIEDSEKLEELGVEVETLASAGENAFYRTNYAIEKSSKTEEDEDAPNATLGALLKKKINEDTTSELIIYSNNIFITNIQIATSPQYFQYALDLYNNEDLAINSIAYLAQRDDTITIRKNVEVTNYTVSEQQNIIILSIIFILPVIIIIVGIIVWQIRRRKR